MAKTPLEPVEKVKKALSDAGFDDRVTTLAAPADSAVVAAKELETDPGAIVRTRVYAIGKRMVMVIYAGDHEIVEDNLPAAFFLEGDVRDPAPAEVKGLTGFGPESVPPVGFTHPLPAAIDRSLKRFKHVFAPAGDRKCVFRTTVDALKRLTGGVVSYNIARPMAGAVDVPRVARTKTFTGERKVPGVEEAG